MKNKIMVLIGLCSFVFPAAYANKTGYENSIEVDITNRCSGGITAFACAGNS